jgi:hypothetical protein
MTDNIPLTDAPRALRAYGLSTTYNALWTAIVAGQVPAERVGKRWYVRADDLAIIAQILKK